MSSVPEKKYLGQRVGGEMYESEGDCERESAGGGEKSRERRAW